MVSAFLNVKTETPPDAALTTETSRIAQHMLANLDEVIRDTNAAVLAAVPPLASTPSTVRASEHGTQDLVSQFLNSVARHPSERPPFKSTSPVLEKAQIAAASGATNREVAFGYQSAKRAVEALWSKSVRSLEREDRSSVPALIAQGSKLLDAYADEAFGAIRTDLATPGTSNPDNNLITSILAGERVDLQRASSALRYPLAAHHTALILWSPASLAPLHAARSAARRLAARLSSSAVHYSMDTRTAAIWLAPTRLMDLEYLRETLAADDALDHIAVGSEQPGVSGFRATFTEAHDTYEFARSNAAKRVITVHADIQVAALATSDITAARHLVSSALGSLSFDSFEEQMLRETLLVFLEEGENAPRAAARLFTHRNTVLYRVRRAKAEIGGHFEERRLAIFLALDLTRQLGSAVLSSTR